MAAQISPAGPRAAGRFGLSLLSIGATTAGGFDVLGSHWQVMEERAAEFDTTVDRHKWRLVGPMHIADTKEQAVADVAIAVAAGALRVGEDAGLPLHRFPLERTADAHAAVEANAVGKVLVDVGTAW